MKALLTLVSCTCEANLGFGRSPVRGNGCARVLFHDHMGQDLAADGIPIFAEAGDYTSVCFRILQER